jgi:hypothetical protein
VGYIALIRHGSWRRDLNAELVVPFTKEITNEWCNVFREDLFASFEAAAIDVITNVARDVENSSPLGLQDLVKIQTQACLEEAKLAMRRTITHSNDYLTDEQKMISRCLAPHIQNHLIDGYDRAAEETGQGSVTRQKAKYLHDIPVLAC